MRRTRNGKSNDPCKKKNFLAYCSRNVHFKSVQPTTDHSLKPGQLLARGICRLLSSHGFVALEEFVPHRGLRADVVGLGPKNEIWIVECKSSRADYQSDAKWQGYLEWCDRYFWGVGPEFPTELLPEDTGLIVADGYGGEILRMGPSVPVASARRKALVQGFAKTAARRLHALRDPGFGDVTN